MSETQTSKLQYTTPQILDFEYHSNPDCEEKKWTMRMTHQKFITRNDEHSATVCLKMEIHSTEDDSPFHIIFTVRSLFKWNDLDETILKSMLNKTAPSLLLGYARPLIALFTNSSGMSPYNIPLIDFTQEEELDISLQ